MPSAAPRAQITSASRPRLHLGALSRLLPPTVTDGPTVMLSAQCSIMLTRVTTPTLPVGLSASYGASPVPGPVASHLHPHLQVSSLLYYSIYTTPSSKSSPVQSGSAQLSSPGPISASGLSSRHPSPSSCTPCTYVVAMYVTVAVRAPLNPQRECSRQRGACPRERACVQVLL